MGDPLQVSKALSDAVERLYEVFAPYKAPRTLDVAPGRDAEAILRALLSAPLRALGEDQVLPYAGWAMTTVGGTTDYKHFLPRIFELAVDNASRFGAEPAEIAGKLGVGRWDGWPEEERSALRAAFLAAWEWVLGQKPPDFDCERWVIGLTMLGDVDRALDAWRQSPSPYAAWHLARVISSEKKFLEDGRGLRGGYWGSVAEEGRLTIAAFLRNEDSQRMLESAVTADTRPDNDEVWWGLENALDMLPPPANPATV